jgi:putative membrane protein
MMTNGCMFGWMWVWPVLVLVSLVLLVAGVVWLVQGRSPARRDLDPAASGRRILDERYARGDIDDEEYRRRRAELR